jgi:hypothetical protein
MATEADPAAEAQPSAVPVEVDVPARGAGPGATPITIPERRERARAWIALSLVGIFGFEVVGAFVALWFCTRLQELKDVITLILGPTVAVIGSVLGFYFGTRDESAEDSGRPPPVQPPP